MPGFYSLYAGEQLPSDFDEDEPEKAHCHVCPEGGVCRGGHLLKALNSWWRSSNMSTMLTQCFEHAACRGAPNSDTNLDIPEECNDPDDRDTCTGPLIEHNESCAPGYMGRLCHKCAPDWGRETFDSCMPCPPKESNTALMALGILAVIGMLVMFIIFTVRTAADAESTSSMMFKTLAAYGQVVGVASLFPYRWPPSIVTLFNFLETITSVSDRILNTDCAMEAPGRKVPLTYEKAILYMLGPICFVSGAIIFWGIVHLVMRVLWLRSSVQDRRNQNISRVPGPRQEQLRVDEGIEMTETRGCQASSRSRRPS